MVQPDCLKGWVMYGTVYGDMHLKNLLGSIVRVGYHIPVPDFYLVLHGLRCRKSTINGLNQTKPNCKIDLTLHLCLARNKIDVYLYLCPYPCGYRINQLTYLSQILHGHYLWKDKKPTDIQG